MRIFLKTEDEIILLRAASQLATRALIEVGRHVVPRLALSHLRNKVVNAVMRTVPTESNFGKEALSSDTEFTFFVNGAYIEPSLEGECMLCEGDWLTVNCWVCLDGYYSFGAHTFIVGSSQDDEPMISTLRDMLRQVVQRASAGHSIKEMSRTVYSLHSHDLYVLQKTFGHGVGRNRVENPILRMNPGVNDTVLLKEGMCLVIALAFKHGRSHFIKPRLMHESTFHNPFVPFGTTVVVRPGRPEILTSFETIVK
jgi:methionyl aminopeptidase